MKAPVQALEDMIKEEHRHGTVATELARMEGNMFHTLAFLDMLVNKGVTLNTSQNRQLARIMFNAHLDGARPENSYVLQMATYMNSCG